MIWLAGAQEDQKECDSAHRHDHYHAGSEGIPYVHPRKDPLVMSGESRARDVYHSHPDGCIAHTHEATDTYGAPSQMIKYARAGE